MVATNILGSLKRQTRPFQPLGDLVTWSLVCHVVANPSHGCSVLLFSRAGRQACLGTEVSVTVNVCWRSGLGILHAVRVSKTRRERGLLWTANRSGRRQIESCLYVCGGGGWVNCAFVHSQIVLTFAKCNFYYVNQSGSQISTQEESLLWSDRHSLMAQPLVGLGIDSLEPVI